jgi:LysR family transcriptional regulator, glycine cleavage system transcriptional activator
MRLPPLSSLRLFEAAGRHQSFKLAAVELNLTASAVSHGVVGLEKFLGVELFVRQPRRLALTPAGAEYLTYVSEALSLIAIATGRLPGRRANRTIAVSCAPTLAARWLVPRLHHFGKQWRDVGVRIDTSQRQVGFPVDGFDFAIRMSRTPVAGSAWTRLFGEHLVPVCSPAYRQILFDDNGAFDLSRATLIHVTSASEDWQAWLDRRGIEDIDASGGLRFDMIHLAFDAAVLGLGVALGRRPLVDRELEAGILVEVSTDTLVAETAYWLVSSDSADSRPDLASFKHWLLQEASAFRRWTNPLSTLGGGELQVEVSESPT